MSALKKFKLPVLVLLGFIFFLLFLSYFLKLIEPTSLPQNVFISNISDHQASISWTTAKPTKGLAVISEDNKFPILPTFAKQIYKDDGEKNLRRQGFYLTHHVTVGDLSPNKTYYYLIYQGWKKVLKGSFTTASTLSSLSAPSPVYGRVLSSDKKPVVGALVYLQALHEATSSSLLSTLTNKDGRWSLDLGNLRYPLASGAAEKAIVETGKSRFKAETKVGQDKPWPDIILK